MQEKHLNELAARVKGVLESPLETEAKIAAETTNLPKGARTPTANEISEMRKFQREYYDQHPKASAREVRRALKRKFNIHVLPNSL